MSDFLEFGWKYAAHRLLSLFKKTTLIDKYLFVVQKGNENWILGAKAKRLSNHLGEESEVMYSQKFKVVPKAPGYFFLHQKYFARALRYNPHLRKAKTIVMFTHPVWTKYYSKAHARFTLNQASYVICLNQQMADDLVEMGVHKEKIKVYHLASNPDFFQPKEQRLGKTVGFCCAFYERKNPELLIETVLNMPHLNFILVGRHWDQYPRFKEIKNLENFTYYENMDYEEYPRLYREMDVFVSPSFLEGGPVPLLEAMLSNIVPVASKTGFCPDIVKHGENGFLFDPEKDSHESVRELIEKALKLEGDVRQGVTEHSWEGYGKKITELFKSL